MERWAVPPSRRSTRGAPSHAGRDLNPARAVEAPRWVVAEPADGGTGADAYTEADLEPAATDALRAAGFAVHPLAPLSEAVGDAQVIRRSGGVLSAAADPRADGSAGAG